MFGWDDIKQALLGKKEDTDQFEETKTVEVPGGSASVSFGESSEALDKKR